MGFVFDKCCCCIELRSGCLIIGYLQLIGEIIATLAIVILFGIGGLVADKGKDDDAKTGGVVMMVVSGVLLFFIIMALAFTITLLVGLHKDRRGHIKAYLVYAAIFFVIGLILFFASFAHKPILVQSVIGNIFALAINLYFLMVIRSYYVKLGEGSRGPAIYNTA